ncbi:MAG: sorbosone dehydrogenase family protein [Chitinophagaceae bacterium]
MCKSIITSVCIPFIVFLFFSCGPALNKGSYQGSANTSGYQADSLAAPHETKSVQNFSKVIGWKNGATPIAPAGFSVTKFAEGLNHPRWIYVAPNGDVFVSEANTELKGIKKIGAKISRKIKTQHYGKSANHVLRFADKDHDGTYETKTVYINGLNQPFGMLVLNNHFYVANTDAILEYDYSPDAESITAPGKTIISLPGQGRHWTKNIITNSKKDKIYIAVGSSSNVAENGLDKELRRANILEINPDGSGEKVYASGLRNPVGMDWAPGTQTLWTAVNERDELGDELVPDYLTSVKENGFYGWPYSYYGQHKDPRMKDNPGDELVKKAIVPDVALGSHTASLGLVFYDKSSFPKKYKDGAFVAQHGSWNRSIISGYKVVFIPFKEGKPSGKPEDFLTGFVSDLSKSEVHGRPVCVALTNDGSLLVTDDVSNTIWKISANSK